MEWNTLTEIVGFLKKESKIYAEVAKAADAGSGTGAGVRSFLEQVSQGVKRTQTVHEQRAQEKEIALKQQRQEYQHQLGLQREYVKTIAALKRIMGAAK